MFDRFTDRAKRVMSHARKAALELNHEYIGTEHILLGLVDEGTGVAANVLKRMTVDLEQIRREVQEIVKTGPSKVTMGQMPFTSRAKKVLELSLEEASQLRHDYIGTEHLLLGLLREKEGIAGQVLRKLGVEPDALREQMLEFLGSPDASDEVRQRFSSPPPHRRTATGTGMFDRFTDRAWKVMDLARKAALGLNHVYIGTEHILLGLVDEGTGVAANVLMRMTVDLEKIGREVEKIVKSDPSRVTMGQLPFTPRAKKVLELSLEEASQLSHNYIGTEHLLLGLIREDEGIAGEVLRSLGVALDAVREQVLEFIGPDRSGPFAAGQRLLRRYAPILRGRDAEQPTSDAPPPPHDMAVVRGRAFVLLPQHTFDSLYDEVIVPALTEAGVDQVLRSCPGANVLEILRAELLLAVMTGQDRNVLYELGLCHALRYDPIQLVAHGENLAPHLRSSRLLEYDDSTEGRTKLREQLTGSARECLERMRRGPGS